MLVSGRGERKTDRVTGEQVYALPRGPHSKPEAKMIYRGMIFHDTRRTSARNLVHAGVPEKVAMAIGGWKTRSVFNRYTIVSPRDVVEAGRKLEFSHSQKVGCAVKGAGPQRGYTRPGTGSLHPVAIRAAGEATRLLKPLA